MPIYEFKCEKCGNIEIVKTAIATAAKSIPCIKCSGNAERIISKPSPIPKSKQTKGKVNK